MSAAKVNVTTIWNGDKVKIQGKKAVGKTMFEIGLIVEGQAKLLCPIDLGYLAASINTQSYDKGTELSSPRPASKEARDQVIRKATKLKPIETNTPPAGFNKITKPNSDMLVLVGTAVEYAPYVEFGTVKMNAQPFLRPALDLASGKMLTLLKDAGRYYFADYLRRPE